MINPRFTLLTLFALAVITLVILTRVAPTMAQSQSAAPATTLPSDEQLDALVTTHDWNGLGAALSRPGSQEGLGRSMNWLRTRIDAGGGFFLGILYARNLWVLGDQYKIDDLSKDLRLTAGMMTLYTYQLIVIDGAKCEDVSAPGHRVEQLFSARAATLAYLKTKPADVKEKIVDLAIALEKKTAPL